MPKNLGQAVENNFIQGLVTEATGMNYPEHAVTESFNVRYNRKGNVNRRLGINYEAGYTAAGDAATGDVSRSFIWNGVGFEGQRTFLVVQSGTTIYFYEAQSGGIYSTGQKDFEIDLTAHGSNASNINIADRACSFASGVGKLFICHPYCEPMYVEYDDVTDDITVTEFTIEVRDHGGLEESGVEAGDRPTTLTNTHKYNLWNQGWWERKVYDGKYPITAFLAGGEGYPSNADVWWIYKDEQNLFDKTLINKVDIGNSESPRGHYIYNAFDINREAKTGIADIESKTTGGIRPSCVAFYSGRVWFGGVNVPGFGNKIYYTQIIVRDEQIGRCYQQNDPTSEEQSDLLDNDGGDILIPDMGALSTFYNMGNALVLFSNNGIWQVSGSGTGGTGFRATDFTVAKVSSTACPTSFTLVEAENVPFWWNFDGIWVLKPDASGIPIAESLSNDTIKTFYHDIPPECRVYAQGAYNPLERTIQWVYRSTTADNTEERFTYDRALELNLTTGAFYPFSWTEADQRIAGIFCAANASVNRSLYLEPVTKTDGETVTATTSGSAGAVTPASAFLDDESSTQTASNSPAGYRSTGDNAFVRAYGVDYCVTVAASHGYIRVYSVDTGTDAIELTDYVTPATLYSRMSLAGTDFSGGISAIAGVGCSVISQAANKLYIVCYNGGTGSDDLFFVHAEISSTGLIDILGVIRQKISTLDINYAPNGGWKMLTQMGTTADTAQSIIGMSNYSTSVSGAVPSIWLLPSIDEIGTSFQYSSDTAVGDSYRKLATELGKWFGNHSSYRPVWSNCFCIPSSTTLSKMYFSMGPGDVNAHIDGAGYYSDQQSPFIDGKTGAYPNGMIFNLPFTISTHPVFDTAASWSLGTVAAAPDLFTDEYGNSNYPFPDTLDTALSLGAANTKGYNDYGPRPTIVYASSKWYAIWTQMLENRNFNSYVGQDTTEALARARIFEINTTDQVCTQKDAWDFIPFDWDTDFAGWTSSSTFYPRCWQIFYDPQSDKMYGHGDVVGTNTREFFCSAGLFTATIVSETVTVPRYLDANPPPTKHKYIGMYNYVCILEESDYKYKDFRARYVDDEGKDFDSYFTSGAKVPGEGHRSATIEYLTIFGNVEETSSAYLKTKWDWSNSSDSNKWSSEQQVYTANRSYRDVSRKRLLIRGSGPAVQLYVRSETSKPFDLIGWSIWFGVDGSP